MSKPSFDILVIGSGIAGLSFALDVANDYSVGVVTKKERWESATNYAQGGIAAAIGPEDSATLHVEDTLETGGGIADPEVVKLVAEEGPAQIRKLMEWGAKFSESGEGELELGREGGHSKHRIVHKADYTGKEVETALIRQARDHPNITLFENTLAVDLVTDRHLRASHRPISKRCYGAYVYNPNTHRVDLLSARATLLCTGGMGHVWRHTTNPPIATGDGAAMAWRAGARLANLEFMQFHPTAFYTEKDKRRERAFLISEAVRGFGAVLRNHRGERFMTDVHKMAELAPRDVVARAIDHERMKWGIDHVWLDVTRKKADDIKTHFPMIYETLKTEFGVDMTQEPIPVVPAAHYQCGGVITDTDAESTIERLFAAGEVAMTGLHGANRLASNSLLEAVVFSTRAAVSVQKALAESKGEQLPDIPEWDDTGTYDAEEWVLIKYDRKEIQKLMGYYVGIVRSDLRLERAKRRLELITEEVEDYWWRTKVSPDLVELRNIAQVSRLVVECALRRKESRGLHFTTDYPEVDDRMYKSDTIV
ncbi:L-aspartate oxidase [bacterium]|nr:L-aspartate oxidase [bacterium]